MKFLVLYSLILLSVDYAESIAEIKSPSSTVINPTIGETQDLRWSYKVQIPMEFVSFSCGKLSYQSEETKLTELVIKKDKVGLFQIVTPLPAEFKGRIQTSVDGDDLIFTISDFRSSDYGKYQCKLKVYNGVEKKVQAIDSTIITLSDTQASPSSGFTAQKGTILGIIFGVVGLIIIILVVCFVVYKYKTREQSGNEKRPEQKELRTRTLEKKDIVVKLNPDDEDENLNTVSSPKEFFHKEPKYAKVGSRISDGESSSDGDQQKSQSSRGGKKYYGESDHEFV